MFNEKILFDFLNLGDDMYAYLSTGATGISGTTEGPQKKTFILPAPTDKITVSSGSSSYMHLKVVLQTPNGSDTTHLSNIKYEGEASRTRYTDFSGLFPKGTKVIVTDTDGYSNAQYTTCTYSTLTFYKIPSDFLGGGD